MLLSLGVEDRVAATEALNLPMAALTDPVTKERLEQLGVAVVGSTPAELAAFLKAEMDKWAPVIKEAGITVRE